MSNKNRFLILGIIILILSFILDKQISYGENELPSKKILILGSYNSENRWEASIVRGIKKSVGENISVKVDYLDSKSADNDIYNESFMELLNLKYMNDSIDCILTIDDEALDLVRKNLFNEQSFIYKKPVVFVGVNSRTVLSEEESEYITGIIQQQDNLLDLDLILNSSKNLEDIYLVLDNSVYSETLKENIKSLQRFTLRPFNMYVIEEYKFEKVKEQLKYIDDSKSAIILCGSYEDGINGDQIPSNKVVSEIKEITKAPIYTKMKFYVESGAIGGIINDGYRLGKMAFNFLTTVLYEENKHILTPSHSSINRPLYNYDALMYYNINPLTLPKNSEFINKGPFDLLVPKQFKCIIWAFLILILLSVILFIYLYIDNKRKVKVNNKLLSESLERHEIKTDFILTVSHELRTPLNIIINATKLLKYKIDGEQYTKEFALKQLELINKNSNRLLRLINNIIDVSKIETGYIDTTFNNENIVDVVEDATLSVVDLASSNNINIIFDTEKEEIITSIDRSKIERIMLNLLSNSIKFTKDGGEIFVSVSKDENNVIIKVRDNGIGMNEELQNHLFEKFRRATFHPSLEREHEGSGLGLFIVKGLVEVHKGTISVESAINHGTTFIITIPIAIVDKENKHANFMKMPIEYTSQIELADIYDKDEEEI